MQVRKGGHVTNETFANQMVAPSGTNRPSLAWPLRRLPRPTELDAAASAAALRHEAADVCLPTSGRGAHCAGLGAIGAGQRHRRRAPLGCSLRRPPDLGGGAPVPRELTLLP